MIWCIAVLFCNATRGADSLAQIARQGRRQRRRHVAVGRSAAGPDRKQIERQTGDSRRELQGKSGRGKERDRSEREQARERRRGKRKRERERERTRLSLR